MLRITEIANGPALVTLKLEGRVVSDWVAVLEQECRRCLEEEHTVVLDFSGVIFIDRPGVEMLARIATRNLQMVNCPPLIEELLQAREKE